MVEARFPDATANTWPQFLHEAKESHAADVPEPRGRVRRGDARQARDREPRRRRTRSTAAYAAIAEWRSYEPEVDLYVSPCYAVELPPEDAVEAEIRLPLSSFLRWVNLTGWAGLAIGNLQLVAPHDETVLAAGLALERG